MKVAHFNDRDPAFFGIGGGGHPESFGWGPSAFAEVRVPVVWQLGLGVLFETRLQGSTDGYDAETSYLYGDYGVRRLVAPVLVIKLPPVVQVVLGPGLCAHQNHAIRQCGRPAHIG